MKLQRRKTETKTYKKTVIRLLCLLFTAFLLFGLSGCQGETGETDPPGSEEEQDPPEEIGEYALSVGDSLYQIGKVVEEGSILEGAEKEDFPEDFPFPAGSDYFGDGLSISTFLVDDERGKGESIFKISTTKDGETPRGIGIGDTLADLQAAYPDLIYENDHYFDEDGLKYNRCYTYAPDDGTVNYIQFFLYEKKIVMMEVADGLDMRPGSWFSYDNIFGMKNIFKEIDHVTSKGQTTTYFYINDAGEEEVLLAIEGGAVEEKDIDEDGITELLVGGSKNNLRTLGIYDFVGGQITYLDINEHLGSDASFYMGDIGNLNGEYRNFIEVLFKNEDGTQRDEVYRFSDNELIYVGPFSDEMLLK